MKNIITLRRQLLACCYHYATATTPVARFWQATEREALLAAIRQAKEGKG